METTSAFDPKDALAALKTFVEALFRQCAESESSGVQLREILRAGERLGKQGHSMPDDLRRIKIDLIMRTEQAKEATTQLEILSKDLRTLLFSIDRAMVNFQVSPTERHQTKGSRKNRNKYPKTPQEILRQFLIAALQEFGGAAHCNEVKDRIREMMAGQFLPGDLLKRSKGEIVWENNVHWERSVLTKEGILKTNSPRGVWELSEKHR